MRARDDVGQVVPLVALVVLVAAGTCLLVVALGGRAADQARAQTAADAAALAGAAAGPDAAEEIAAANGASLVAFVADGDTVRVTVRVGDATAVARGARTLAPGPSAYSGRDVCGPRCRRAGGDP